MSNIEQSLSLLLPTLSDPIPPELVALSNSLLAQSRNKASNLKSEEEIARPYACCEIACKRLGTKLALPALRGRPPCAPKVYKKLLTFLEQALPAKLPTKAAQATSRDGSSARSTPRRAAPPSTPRTTPKKRSTAFAGNVLQSRVSNHEQNDDGAPSWAMPLIRRLCRTFLTPLLAPHVYTGLCVVMGLAKLGPGREDEGHSSRSDAIHLTLAIFLMVLARMQRGKVSRESYLTDCECVCAVAREESLNVGLSKEQVDDWIKKISSEGWTTGQEWWSSVPEDAFDRTGKQPTQGLEDDHAAELISRKKRRIHPGLVADQDPEGALLPGLGTMMQESVDWLSEDRRADYLAWRAGIEKRLERMEKGLGRERTKARGVTAGSA